MLAKWFQHWVQHRVRFLWRSHRVHHSDLDVDFTTSLRFHPFEAVFSTLVRILAVAALGVPVPGALVYEVGLNVSGTLSHANLPIPERVDAILRWLLVTPDVHRVHHSAAPEMEHNYGSVMTLWDRLFRTYQAQPEKGHLDMELGLRDQRDGNALHLFALLLLPFRPDRSR